jgi:transcriptional regulator
MRHTPEFAVEDLDWVKRLVRENPWATLVSGGPAGLVASHYPILLDEDAPGLVLFSHVGRPDELQLDLTSEILVIVQGPHGYISPSWYDAPVAVPTWNFTTAHLYGVPEILSDEANLVSLDRLVAAFEQLMPHPRYLKGTPENEAYARSLVGGTVGFRLPVTRWVGKNKLSQNKPAATIHRVRAGLADGPAANQRLAAAMEREYGALP